MKPNACVGCPLYDVGEGFVPGTGPLTAKLMFVGEAPGADDASEGKPFVGGAGRLLTGLLKQAGIQRYTAYIDNVLRCRPPKNVYPKGKVRKDAERHCRVHDPDGCNPVVVVALGDKALTHLTGRKGITHWRGSILDVVPTISQRRNRDGEGGALHSGGVDQRPVPVVRKTRRPRKSPGVADPCEEVRQ
jgi:uracil-DNA glycosylase family 4